MILLLLAHLGLSISLLKHGSGADWFWVVYPIPYYTIYNSIKSTPYYITLYRLRVGLLEEAEDMSIKVVFNEPVFIYY